MQELRKSGIEAVGDVPWGAHFCQFYQTKNDLTGTLAPYFKAGLEGGEFCMWVTSDPLTPADARQALEQAVSGFPAYLQNGQIEIIPHSEWYLKGGSFNLDRVLKGWADKLEEALARGFTGMRVTGNTAWLERADWNNFAEYEAAINGVIGKRRMLALCTYSLDKCNAADVMDVICNHEFALMMKEGRWQLIENSAYKEAKLSLLASERKYQSLFNAMTEGFALHEIILDSDGKPCDYRFLEVNPAFERLTRLKAERLMGKTVRQVMPNITDFWIETFGKVALTGEPVVFESFAERLDTWYEVYAYSPDKGRFVSLFRDITQHKKAEQLVTQALRELQQRSQETSALFEAARSVLKHTRFEDSARAIFDSCKKLIGAGGGYVALKSADGVENAVLFLDSGGQPCSVDQSLPMPIRGLRAEAYRTGRVVYDNDFAGSEWAGLMPAGHLAVRNVLFAPLVIERDAAGLLGLANKPEGFTEGDARLAAAFGGLAAIALLNSRTLESLESSEQALRETTDYLENLFSYANAPIIVWDPQFRITRFNRAFERLTGISAGHVLGKQLDILFPGESRGESMSHIRKAMAGERWEAVEIPIRRTDGTVRIVLWNSANVYSPEDETLAATIAQGQDITERKQAETALREREAEVSAILESAPMLLLLVDPDRRVLKSNKAAAEFAGRQVEEMLGLRSGEALRCLHSLADPRGCGFGLACDSCVTRRTVLDTVESRNSHYQVECRLPFVRGGKTEDLTFLLYTVPLSMPQERTLVCIQDVTALKKSEEQVKSLNLQLTERAAELESANRELESFAYSVSHDLRAPLRSMEGFSQMLQEDYGERLDNQGRDYLRRIQGSSETMAHLIDDILTLSRITRSDMQREAVDLSRMVRSIVKEIRERDPKRRARFRIARGVEAGGDAKLLQLVLSNLLENAWKFTSKAPQAWIEFGVKESNGKKTYFVRDNGVGFDMAYVDKLFRPFQRLHASTEFPGTGIGLASVQRIIRRHGGQIRAEGETGKGATFYFTLG